MEPKNNQLRILLIVNLPWDSRLGAVRVYMDLAEQWEKSGHIVTKYSLSDAFPQTRVSPAKFTVRQLLFVHKAAVYVKKNGARFDVIDGLIGVLPFSKSELGFKGLLVARSVGLYRLYERFDRSVPTRWPDLPKGKLFGRIFYRLSGRKLFRDAEKAVRSADLINVPNEDESICLRCEIERNLRILVQPYGLTDERRAVLLGAADNPLIRLAQKRICFIGMWGPRKGSRDWFAIMKQIRARVPEAQFRFLGTMVDSETILADLQVEMSEGIEFVSAYQPGDLGGLLADCTVGAFPSYAEGFGLGVLEQLAAGLPTVAYDTAGPRDILASQLPELLIPKGDIGTFAGTICKILQGSHQEYERVSRRSIEAAAGFSLPDIAAETLQTYRDFLKRESTGRVMFVQPFSFGSAGGGPRILRALLERAPFSWQSVCTSPQNPKSWPNEIHLPNRPGWARIERSRFASIPNRTAPFFASSFRQRLKKICLEQGACALHAVPHSSLDFAQVHAVAADLGLPFFISLHDDLAYTARTGVSARAREEAMGAAWREAAGRFVISEALGEEYCRRYGRSEYQVVTDGLTSLTPSRDDITTNPLRIYFMGLFHVGYERNLRAFLDGLAILEQANPSLMFQVICRCEHIRAEVIDGSKRLTVLPFATEAQIQLDLETADLLYMPMPFGEEHDKFARYSLSTKMVTYAGSGIPILYHGPDTSAAFDLLQKNQAAVFVTSLDPHEIAETLSSLTPERRKEIATNALGLARRQFMLDDQTRKFWGAFTKTVSPT